MGARGQENVSIKFDIDVSSGLSALQSLQNQAEKDEKVFKDLTKTIESLGKRNTGLDNMSAALLGMAKDANLAVDQLKGLNGALSGGTDKFLVDEVKQLQALRQAVRKYRQQMQKGNKVDAMNYAEQATAWANAWAGNVGKKNPKQIMDSKKLRALFKNEDGTNNIGIFQQLYNDTTDRMTKYAQRNGIKWKNSLDSMGDLFSLARESIANGMDISGLIGLDDSVFEKQINKMLKSTKRGTRKSYWEEAEKLRTAQPQHRDRPLYDPDEQQFAGRADAKYRRSLVSKDKYVTKASSRQEAMALNEKDYLQARKEYQGKIKSLDQLEKDIIGTLTEYKNTNEDDTDTPEWQNKKLQLVQDLQQLRAREVHEQKVSGTKRASKISQELQDKIQDIYEFDVLTGYQAEDAQLDAQKMPRNKHRYVGDMRVEWDKYFKDLEQEQKSTSEAWEKAQRDRKKQNEAAWLRQSRQYGQSKNKPAKPEASTDAATKSLKEYSKQLGISQKLVRELSAAQEQLSGLMSKTDDEISEFLDSQGYEMSRKDVAKRNIQNYKSNKYGEVASLAYQLSKNGLKDKIETMYNNADLNQQDDTIVSAAMEAFELFDNPNEYAKDAMNRVIATASKGRKPAPRSMIRKGEGTGNGSKLVKQDDARRARMIEAQRQDQAIEAIAGVFLQEEQRKKHLKKRDSVKKNKEEEQDSDTDPDKGKRERKQLNALKQAVQKYKQESDARNTEGASDYAKQVVQLANEWATSAKLKPSEVIKSSKIESLFKNKDGTSNIDVFEKIYADEISQSLSKSLPFYEPKEYYDNILKNAQSVSKAYVDMQNKTAPQIMRKTLQSLNLQSSDQNIQAIKHNTNAELAQKLVKMTQGGIGLSKLQEAKQSGYFDDTAVKHITLAIEALSEAQKNGTVVAQMYKQAQAAVNNQLGRKEYTELPMAKKEQKIADILNKKINTDDYTRRQLQELQTETKNILADPKYLKASQYQKALWGKFNKPDFKKMTHEQLMQKWQNEKINNEYSGKGSKYEKQGGDAAYIAALRLAKKQNGERRFTDEQIFTAREGIYSSAKAYDDYVLKEYGDYNQIIKEEEALSAKLKQITAARIKRQEIQNKNPQMRDKVVKKPQKATKATPQKPKEQKADLSAISADFKSIIDIIRSELPDAIRSAIEQIKASFTELSTAISQMVSEILSAQKDAIGNKIKGAGEDISSTASSLLRIGQENIKNAGDIIIDSSGRTRNDANNRAEMNAREAILGADKVIATGDIIVDSAGRTKDDVQNRAEMDPRNAILGIGERITQEQARNALLGISPKTTRQIGENILSVRNANPNRSLFDTQHYIDSIINGAKIAKKYSQLEKTDPDKFIETAENSIVNFRKTLAHGLLSSQQNYKIISDLYSSQDFKQKAGLSDIDFTDGLNLNRVFEVAVNDVKDTLITRLHDAIKGFAKYDNMSMLDAGDEAYKEVYKQQAIGLMQRLKNNDAYRFNYDYDLPYLYENGKENRAGQYLWQLANTEKKIKPSEPVQSRVITQESISSDLNSVINAIKSGILDIGNTAQSTISSIQGRISALGLLNDSSNAYKTLKDWGQSDAILDRMRNGMSMERGAYINSKTGDMTSPFLYDNNDVFDLNLMYQWMNRNGRRISDYDTSVHSHPMRQLINPFQNDVDYKTIGYDLMPSEQDFNHWARDSMLGINKMMIQSGGKILDFDFSDIRAALQKSGVTNVGQILSDIITKIGTQSETIADQYWRKYIYDHPEQQFGDMGDVWASYIKTNGGQNQKNKTLNMSLVSDLYSGFIKQATNNVLSTYYPMDKSLSNKTFKGIKDIADLSSAQPSLNDYLSSVDRLVNRLSEVLDILQEIRAASEIDLHLKGDGVEDLDKVASAQVRSMDLTGRLSGVFGGGEEEPKREQPSTPKKVKLTRDKETGNYYTADRRYQIEKGASGWKVNTLDEDSKEYSQSFEVKTLNEAREALANVSESAQEASQSLNRQAQAQDKVNNAKPSVQGQPKPTEDSTTGKPANAPKQEKKQSIKAQAYDRSPIPVTKEQMKNINQMKKAIPILEKYAKAQQQSPGLYGADQYDTVFDAFSWLQDENVDESGAIKDSAVEKLLQQYKNAKKEGSADLSKIEDKLLQVVQYDDVAGTTHDTEAASLSEVFKNNKLSGLYKSLNKKQKNIAQAIYAYDQLMNSGDIDLDQLNKRKVNPEQSFIDFEKIEKQEGNYLASEYAKRLVSEIKQVASRAQVRPDQYFKDIAEQEATSDRIERQLFGQRQTKSPVESQRPMDQDQIINSMQGIMDSFEGATVGATELASAVDTLQESMHQAAGATHEQAIHEQSVQEQEELIIEDGRRNKPRTAEEFEADKIKQLEKDAWDTQNAYSNEKLYAERINMQELERLKQSLFKKYMSYMEQLGDADLSAFEIGSQNDQYKDQVDWFAKQIRDVQQRAIERYKANMAKLEEPEAPTPTKSKQEMRRLRSDALISYGQMARNAQQFSDLSIKYESGVITEQEQTTLKKLTQSFIACQQSIEAYSAAMGDAKEKTDAIQKAQNKLQDANRRASASEQQKRKAAQNAKYVYQNDSAIANVNQMLKQVQDRNVVGLEDKLKVASENINKYSIEYARSQMDKATYIKKAQKELSGIKNVRRVMDTDDVSNAKSEIQKMMIAEAQKKGYVLDPRDIIDNGGTQNGRHRYSANIQRSDKMDQTLVYSFDEQTRSIQKLDGKLIKHEGLLSKFGTSWKNKLMEMGAYLASFASIYQVFDWLKRGVQTVTEFDTALTEMRKVSDESVSSLKNFQVQSFDLADSVGTTGLQIQQSTADFMRLGQSLTQAKESAKNASLLLNVSQFGSIDQATTSLIAMTQAFDEYSQMDILDSLNKVGNQFSISTEGLSTALQVSASALRTQGNDLAESIALITAANQVVQDPDKVGAGIRTISLRLAGQKQTLADQGEDVSDMTETTSKLRENILNATRVKSNEFLGVDIEDANGNLRSTYDILLDISQIWKQIGEKDKQNGTNEQAFLLETMAGKNRSNILASLLESPEILKQSYDAANNAAGSAQQENAKFMESIQGKQKQFMNTLQEFTTTLMQSDFIKGVIDFGTQVLNVINDIIKGVGSLNTVIGGSVLAKGIASFVKNFDTYKLLGQKANNMQSIFEFMKSSSDKGLNASQTLGQLINLGSVDINDKKLLPEVQKSLGKVFGKSTAADAIGQYLGETIGQVAGNVAQKGLQAGAKEAVTEVAKNVTQEAIGESVGNIVQGALQQTGDVSDVVDTVSQVSEKMQEIGEAVQGTKTAGDVLGDIGQGAEQAAERIGAVAESAGQVTEKFEDVSDSVNIFDGLKAKITSIGTALKGVGSAIKGAVLAHPFIAIGAAVATAIAAIAVYKKKQKEAFKTQATEATSNWEESKASLQEYIDKYSQLKTQLDSGDLSEQEQIGVKQQILDLQKQIVQQYGSQASGIDLVNGKLTEQLGILNGISQNEARQNIAENSSAYNDAMDEMNEKRFIKVFQDLNDIQGTALEGQINKIAQKYQNLFKGADITAEGYSTNPFIEFVGNASQAKKVLDSVIDDLSGINNIPDEQSDLLRNLVDQANHARESINGVLTDYQSNYKSVVEQTMYANGGSGKITDLSLAISQYNDALLGSNQQAIDSARQKYKEAKTQMSSFLGELMNSGMIDPKLNSGLLEYFTTMQEGLNETQLQYHDFKEMLSDTMSGEQFDKGNIYADKFDDSIQKITKDVKGMDLDQVDVQAMWDIQGTNAQEDAVRDLAEAFGLTKDMWGSGTAQAESKLRQFINALVQAGVITGQVAAQAAQAEEQLGSVWDDQNLTDIQEATQQKELGDNYDAYVKNLKRAKELRESNDVGTKEFKALAKSFSPSGSTGWQNFDQNLGDAESWFSGDETKDITNFLNEMKQAGFATQDEAGEWSLGIMNLGQAAKKTARPVQQIVAMLGLLNDKGFDVTAYGSAQQAMTGLKDKTIELSEAEQQLANMKKLQQQGDGDYTLAIAEQQEYVQRLRGQIETTTEMIPDLVKKETETAKQQAKVAGEYINQMYEQYKAIEEDSSMSEDTKQTVLHNMEEQIRAFAEQNGLTLDITGATLTVDENSAYIQKTKDAIDAYQRGNQKKVSELANELASAEYQATQVKHGQSILSKLGFNLQGVDTKNTQAIAQAITSQIGDVGQFFKQNGLTTDMQNLSSDITSNASQNAQAIIAAINGSDEFKSYDKNKKQKDWIKDYTNKEDTSASNIHGLQPEYNTNMKEQRRDKVRKNRLDEAESTMADKPIIPKQDYKSPKQVQAQKISSQVETIGGTLSSIEGILSKNFEENQPEEKPEEKKDNIFEDQSNKPEDSGVFVDYSKLSGVAPKDDAPQKKDIEQLNNSLDDAQKALQNQAQKNKGKAEARKTKLDEVESTMASDQTIDKGSYNRRRKAEKERAENEIKRAKEYNEDNIPDAVKDYIHEQGIDTNSESTKKFLSDIEHNKPQPEIQAQVQIQEYNAAQKAQNTRRNEQSISQGQIKAPQIPFGYNASNWLKGKNGTITDVDLGQVLDKLPPKEKDKLVNAIKGTPQETLPLEETPSKSKTSETTPPESTLPETTIQADTVAVETNDSVQIGQKGTAEIEAQESEFTGSADTKQYSTFQDVDHALYGDVQPTAAVVAKIMQDWGIPTDQTQFGNVDLNNRQVLNWDQPTVQKFKTAIQSWGEIPSDLIGTYSTVLGGSGEWNDREIAYSPIDQREGGEPYYLSSGQLDEYMWGIISNAIRDHGEGFSSEDLIAADKQGYTLENGQKIDNLIAAVSKSEDWQSSAVIGQLMHFLGSNGALNGELNSQQQQQPVQQQQQVVQETPTVETQQQITARATITEVNAPEDTSVPVTGQMDTVQNQVTQKPQVKVQGVVNQIKQDAKSDQPRTVTRTIKEEVKGGDKIDKIKKQASGDITLNSNIVGNALDGLIRISKAKQNIEGNPNVKISANVSGNAMGQTTGILSNLRSLQSIGDITNTVTTVKIEKTIKQGSDAQGTFKLRAHASGTVDDSLFADEYSLIDDPNNEAIYSNASGTFRRKAYISGTEDVSLKSNETALVNELGTESIVRNGQWFPIPGGPHVENLKKGDIIFNKKQTEQLIKTGKASGYGKAYATGTVPGMPAHGFLSKTAKSVAQAAASAQASSKGSPMYNNNNSKNDSKAKKENSDATQKNTKATKDNTKEKENEGQVFDWVASRLSYLADQTAKFADAITDFITYEDKLLNLVGGYDAKLRKDYGGGQLEALVAQIAGNRAGAVRYKQEANNVKNPYENPKNAKEKEANQKFADTKAMIDAGYKIDIQTIKDQKLSKAIQDYQQYADAATQAANNVANLNRAIIELYDTWAKSPAEEAEKQIERLAKGINGLDSVEARLDAYSKGGSTQSILDGLLRNKPSSGSASMFAGYRSVASQNRLKTSNYEEIFKQRQLQLDRVLANFREFQAKQIQQTASVIRGSSYNKSVSQSVIGEGGAVLTKKQLKEQGKAIANQYKKSLTKKQQKALKKGKTVKVSKISDKATKEAVSLQNQRVSAYKAQSAAVKQGKKIAKQYSKKLNDQQKQALQSGQEVDVSGVKNKKLKKKLNAYNKKAKKSKNKMATTTTETWSNGGVTDLVTAQDIVGNSQQGLQAFLDAIHSAETDEIQAAAELAAQKVQQIRDNFDYINEAYETQISYQESLNKLNEQFITDAETFGNEITASMRDTQRANMMNLRNLKNREVNSLQKQLQAGMDAGTIKKNSKEWIEMTQQINEAKAAVHDYDVQIKQLEIKKLEDITDHYSKLIDYMQTFADLNNVWNERDEIVGNYKQATYYTQKITEAEAIRNKKQEQARKEQLQFQRMIGKKDSGATYEVGSDSYIAKQAEINKLWKEAYDAQNDLAKLQAERIQFEIDNFNRILEKQDTFISNLNTMSGLINDAAKWDYDTGNLTQQGQLTMVIDKEGFNQALEEIQAVATEKQALLERLRNDASYGQQAYDEDIKELTSKQMSYLQTAKSALESFTKTVETTAQKQLEALNKVIDKRKAALQKEKEYHDYDKQLKNSNKEIALLEAQSRALQGVADAESKAMKARIDAQITQKRQAQQDTIRDHTVSLQTEGLSDLQNKMQQNYEKWSQEFEANAQQQLAVMQSTNMTSQQMSNTMNAMLASFGTNMAQMGLQVSTANTATTAAVNGMTGVFNAFTQDTTAYDLALQSNRDKQDLQKLAWQTEISDTMTGKLAEQWTYLTTAGEATLLENMMLDSTGDTLVENLAIIDESVNALPQTLGELSDSELDALDASIGTITTDMAKQANVLASASGDVASAVSTAQIAITTAIQAVIDAIGQSAATISNTYTTYSESAASASSSKSKKNKKGKNNSKAKSKSSNKSKTKKKGSKKAALGRMNINKDDIYLTQENGGEIITTKEGVLIPLKAGDGVVPAQLTEKLFEMARERTEAPTMQPLEIPNLTSSGTRQNVTVTYGSLLTVNGNVDKEVLPSLKTILQESYEYTQKKLTQDALKGGMRRNR